MTKLRNLIYFLSLANFCLVTSFLFFYSDENIYNANFSNLDYDQYELLIIYNLSLIFVYFIVDYIFRFESVISFFTLVFSLNVSLILLILWFIKFISLSRLFLFSNYFAFILILLFLSRVFEYKKNYLYITFNKEILSKLKNVKYIDEKTFPAQFLNDVSILIKTRHLKGIVFQKYSSNNFKFQDLVEVSNFIGLDIYEIKDEKLKLIHKSTSINKFIKNLEDLILLALFGIPSIILLVVFSIVLFLFQGRPIFYKQTRVGENGKYFEIYKFRTMVNKQLSKNEIDRLNERDKIVFKAANDPRITKIGTLYRKSSIDELPQIINVFKNEMSFIGPRPPIVSEVGQYELKHLKRISVKPGITGLWQVTLRQNNNFDLWVEKDIEYIESWSVLSDLKILYKTIFEITRMTGS